MAEYKNDLSKSTDFMAPPDEEWLETLEKSVDLRVLPNEKFDEALDTAYNVARETGSPLSVLHIDINQLKPVNDSLGHGRGTSLIKDINNMAAIVVRTTFRINPSEDRNPGTLDVVSLPTPRDEDDIDAEAGRTGGDEMSVFANVPADVAKLMAQRVLDVADLYLAKPENEELRELGVGVAVGWATYEPGMSKEELVEKADQAMYLNKLNQLPHLNRMRRIMFDLGRISLKLSKVEPRNVDKYVQKHNLSKK